jgi:hypothetical protein
MPGRGEYRLNNGRWRPLVLIMPPLYKPHKFFIGRESPKDVWVKQLSQRKKILVANVVKEEFKDIELHDGGGLNFMVIRDTQSPRRIDFRGYRGIVFLDYWFQRCSTSLHPTRIQKVTFQEIAVFS